MAEDLHELTKNFWMSLKKKRGSRQKVEVRKILGMKRETLLELAAIQSQLELREGCQGKLARKGREEE